MLAASGLCGYPLHGCCLIFADRGPETGGAHRRRSGHEPGKRIRGPLRLAPAPRNHDHPRKAGLRPGILRGDSVPAAGKETGIVPFFVKISPPKGAANWDLVGSAARQCVTGVGHKVQPPLGPSTSDASANWDLAGKARSKCVTNVGHKVQLPLGPSTGEASANWDLAGRSPLLGEGGSRSETGVGRYNLPGSAPHPPQCAHWGTFPQGKASPRQIPIDHTG